MLRASEPLWLDFQKKHHLTDAQRTQFAQYAHALIQFNKTHNITAITTPERVMVRHFDDSLALQGAIDLTTIQTLCDVGTGGGFPAIPLKIVYPHLQLVLIEVNHKKVLFLRDLCTNLHLENVIIDTRDWRTFLRSPRETVSDANDDVTLNADRASYTIDLFVSRASLAPDELLRVYRQTSPYRNTPLVYWAADTWAADKKNSPYVTRIHDYHAGSITRKLIFFGTPPHAE